MQEAANQGQCSKLREGHPVIAAGCASYVLQQAAETLSRGGIREA